jgi:23S rRNA (adenine2503-C2)-methyltransferase
MEKIKQNLTGLTLPELELFVQAIGEKKFRGRQLFGWIYQKRAVDFNEMTDLAKALREKLADLAVVGQVQQIGRQDSTQSGTIKFLHRLQDGAMIESVYIPESSRRTCCVSTQVGCACKCSFCATGAMGFKRDLSAGEIVDQVIQAERDARQEITNVVLMGMGEPLLNYDAVLKACDLLNDENGLAVGSRHIVVSTVGIIPAIYRYADEGRPYRLAISLHSAMDEKRQKLLPIAKKYPLPELMQAIRYYSRKARQHPTIEYVLLAGVNDGEEDAVALRQVLQGLSCKINLIPYNAALTKFKAPDTSAVEKFASRLLPLHAPVSVRWSKGSDINAACGQLATLKNTNRQHSGK